VVAAFLLVPESERVAATMSRQEVALFTLEKVSTVKRKTSEK